MGDSFVEFIQESTQNTSFFFLGAAIFLILMGILFYCLEIGFTPFGSITEKFDSNKAVMAKKVSFTVSAIIIIALLIFKFADNYFEQPHTITPESCLFEKTAQTTLENAIEFQAKETDLSSGEQAILTAFIDKLKEYIEIENLCQFPERLKTAEEEIDYLNDFIKRKTKTIESH